MIWIPPDKVNGHSGACECAQCHYLEYCSAEEHAEFVKNQKETVVNRVNQGI